MSKSDKYSEYMRMRISTLTPPTATQTNNFIQELSTAHSWYKHLSYEEPTDFVFTFGLKEKPEEQIERCWYWEYWIPSAPFGDRFGFTYLPPDIIEKFTIGLNPYLWPSGGIMPFDGMTHKKVVRMLRGHLQMMIEFLHSDG